MGILPVDLRVKLNSYWYHLLPPADEAPAAGRRTEAMAQFEAIVRLAPNHTGAQAALDRLRSLR